MLGYMVWTKKISSCQLCPQLFPLIYHVEVENHEYVSIYTYTVIQIGLFLSTAQLEAFQFTFKISTDFGKFSLHIFCVPVRNTFEYGKIRPTFVHQFSGLFLLRASVA